MRREKASIMRRHISTKITVGALSWLAGSILPFAVIMTFTPCADVSRHVIGVLLFAAFGLLLYLAVRVLRKYEGQEEKSKQECS